MNTLRSRSQKFVLTSIALISLWFLSATTAWAQAQFTNNNADLSKRGSLTVDPTTLALNLQIPLGAYPGRGGAGLPLVMIYNSKVWRATTAQQLGAGQGAIVIEPKFAEQTNAGWISTLSPPWIEEANGEHTFTSGGIPYYGYPCTFEYVRDGMCSPNQSSYYIVYRKFIHMPDGTTVEVRKSDVPSLVDVNHPADYSGSYTAIDGSGMRLDVTSGGAQTLWLPNGSKYVWGNGVVTFHDSNGNNITFGSSGVTDVFGNLISTQKTGSGLSTDVTFTIPGVGGSTKQVVIRWRSLQSSFGNTSYQLKYIGGCVGWDTFNQICTQSLSPSLFSQLSISNSDFFNPSVLKEIELPNGQKYIFSYNEFGEIEKVQYPSGAYERFRHDQIQSISFQRNAFAQTNRGVVERWISPTGNVTEEQHWTFSAGFTQPNFQGDYRTTLTAPDGTKLERFLHAIRNSAKFGFNNPLAGRTFDERVYDQNNNLLRRTLSDWTVTETTVDAKRYPRLLRKTNIVIEGSSALAQSQTMEYSDLSVTDVTNVTASDEYGFVTVDLATAQTGTIGTIPLGTKVHRREVTYNKNSAYLDRRLVRLVSSSKLLDPSNNVVSQSETVYDEAAYAPFNYGGVPSGWTSPGTTALGHPTTSRVWLNTLNGGSGGWVATHLQADQFGNIIKTWDELNRVGEVEFSPTYQYAYPTLTRTPIPDPTGTSGSSTALTSTTVYDFSTGLPVSTTDENGQTVTMEYNDPLNRLTATTPPPGGGRTEIVYGDTPGNLFVRTRSQFETNRWAESAQYFDGFGRMIRTERYDPAGSVYTDIQYDTMGRLWKVSNPYRIGDLVKWKISSYDPLSRISLITTPDNASISTSYGISTTGVIGVVLTVTDQSGKVRRAIKDCFGRNLRVDEPDGNNQLGTLNGPNQSTTYSYDLQGNLVQVAQGVQTRTFVYDSLSRLTLATAPESGTTSYTYDLGGNVLTKTDARGVVVTNYYDALDRVTQRSYTLTTNVGATSTAQYFYDGAGLGGITPNFAKGTLTKVTNGSASYEYRNFDSLGRVLSARQIIDGNNYDTSYSYNLAGALISETYPSGRTVTNTYEADGSLNSVSGRAPGRAIRVYASNFEYAAHGSVTKFQYGSGLWEETTFNSRLQLTGRTLRKQANTLWNVTNDYGTTDNNGNIKSQSILHPGITQPLVQTYNYDSLNRLTQVVENQNSVEQWKQTFTYDRYGNRTVVANQTKSEMIGPNPFINQANNRIVQQQGEQYAYDEVGNLTVDQTGKRFTFDGENKVVTYFGNPNSPTTVTAEYRYDADGRRVKKIVGNVTTLFVYDAMGKMIAEYSINAPVPEPRTQYLTADTLSSQRVISDGQGIVTSRRDFAPFGEELPSNSTNRQAVVGYANGGDRTKQRFATYERDEESGLDFAQARFYNSRYGRFLSQDPFGGSGRIENPKTWNRYAYVLNNPLNWIDPTGLEAQGDLQELPPVPNGFKYSGETLTTVGGAAVVTEIEYVYPKPQALTAFNIMLAIQLGQVEGIFNFVAGSVRQSHVYQAYRLYQYGPQGLERSFLFTPFDSLDFQKQILMHPVDSAEAVIDAIVQDPVNAIQTTTAAATEVAAAEVIPGTVGGLRKANIKDAHHIIQDAAVKNLPGYNTNLAPGVPLSGPSTLRGSPHYNATQVQRQRGGGTYGAERRIGYKAMRKAGLSKSEARGHINRADAYFESIGVTRSTKTVIPGNRW